MISFFLMFYLLHLCFFALFPKKSNKKKDWFISLYFYQENLSILIFESILPNLGCVLSIGYFVIYKKLIFQIFLDCNNMVSFVHFYRIRFLWFLSAIYTSLCILRQLTYFHTKKECEKQINVHSHSLFMRLLYSHKNA